MCILYTKLTIYRLGAFNLYYVPNIIFDDERNCTMQQKFEAIEPHQSDMRRSGEFIHL